MSRKTFSIETFKQSVNDFIRNDKNRDGAARLAMAIQLENILHATGNYDGFNYLKQVELEFIDMVPGINVMPDGMPMEDYDARFAGTDRTRIRFY